MTRPRTRAAHELSASDIAAAEISFDAEHEYTLLPIPDGWAGHRMTSETSLTRVGHQGSMVQLTDAEGSATRAMEALAWASEIAQRGAIDDAELSASRVVVASAEDYRAA